MPTFFLCLGPISRPLGGPKGALEAPKISQNNGTPNSIPSKPKWVGHWLNEAWHCLTHPRWPVWALRAPKKWHREAPEALKRPFWPKMPIGTIGTSNSSRWVGHWLDKVGHYQTHLEGSIWTIKVPKKWHQRPQRRQKWPFLDVLGPWCHFMGAQNFGPISIKIGQIVRITKKMTLNKCGPGSGPNYGETAVCPLGREGNKWPKLRFSLYKHPQNGYSPLIIW